MRHTVSLASAVLIAAAAVVRFGVAPRLLERLQPGDEWLAVYVGIVSTADAQTGVFPPPVPMRYTRRLTVAADPARPDAVAVEDVYTTIDPDGAKVTFQHVHHDTVDRTTARHLDEPHGSEDVYMLPRFTEKKEYRVRSSYLPGLPLRFEAEETLAGLETYVFSYRGAVEYTAAYTGTAEYPGVPVTPGQEIRCGDDQFVYRMWVEPVTGEMLKVQESCLAGDYIYERASGRRLTPLMVWSGETSGDDIVDRSEAIRADRTRVLLATRYAPAGLLLAGLVVLAAGLARRRRTET